MASAELVTDKVCPLLNAGLAAKRPMAEQRTAANECRKDCQWFGWDDECAVKVVASQATEIADTLRDIYQQLRP